MAPFVKKATIAVGGVTALAAAAAAYVVVRKAGRPVEVYAAHRASLPKYGPTPPSADLPEVVKKREPMPIESADPTPKPGVFGAAKEVVYEFVNDDVMTQAAALAFYAGLAFAPLITVAVWFMGMFYSDAGKDKVAKALGQVVGPEAADGLKDVLASAKAVGGWNFAGFISLVLVLFSASGVFGQVQAALNAIWHVQSKPASGVMGFIKKRTLSLGMLASILFLLMTSLIVSVGLEAVLSVMGGSLGPVLGQIGNQVASVLLFTLLFAALFRFVPDAKIEWRPVWIGAIISAVLFTAGKYGLSIYLGHSDYNSSYGAAAGSFIALLAWVYYSSVIVLIGAEVTEVTARRLGHALEPDEHAVRIKQVEVG